MKKLWLIAGAPVVCAAIGGTADAQMKAKVTGKICGDPTATCRKMQAGLNGT